MMNFEELRSVAFDWISKRETVRILSLQEARKLQLGIFVEVWEVTTEIINAKGLIEVATFNLGFEGDFPLSIPKVYLTVESFNKYKYLAHTQTDHFICTFNDDSQANIDLPGQVVEAVLRRAKRIIEDGLTGRNESDFDDEFSAYWTLSYSNSDKPKETILSILQSSINSSFKLISLDKPIGKFTDVIHQEEIEAIRFKDYLKENQFKYKEYEGLNVGPIPITKPPFAFTNKQTFEIIQKANPLIYAEFIKFINKHQSPIFILFSKLINGSNKYFGWTYRHPVLNRKGFRGGKIKSFQALSIFQGNDPVTRFSLEDISNIRISTRTTGRVEETKHCFVIVGIGSVGSNLVHLLSSIQNSQFKLIDDEKLFVENIGRHLLGLHDVGMYKTKGVLKHLSNKMPTLNVSSREDSITDILQKDISYINNSTYLFLAIGNTSIERYISTLLREKVVIVPTFILWVEPYLAGGHCIFLDPLKPHYDDFFDEIDLFRGNVISKKEYSRKNPILSKREAGCQTSYVPYSSSDMLSFLGSLFPYILNIIRNNEKGTRGFSWVGNLMPIKELGLEITSEYQSQLYGTIVESKL
ncbi:MAG TPA: E2/UBC family protein [Cyclobacteriaceae bacterium]|jgi:hypothetical protein|nr:E2/UBC family protein [Cyclobacteriaceae bacterium]